MRGAEAAELFYGTRTGGAMPPVHRGAHEAARLLVEETDDSIPPQDLSLDLATIPAKPP